MEFVSDASIPRHISFRKWNALFATIFIVCFSFSAAATQVAPLQIVSGHIPKSVSRLHLPPLDHLPASNRLTLGIGLPLRNQSGLTNLLKELYDPRSANFHHFLTPAQFVEKFGPSSNDYQTLIAFARANGLKIISTHTNRSLLMVNGAVADVEKALHVRMRTYRHPKEARNFFAPDAEPSVDLNVPLLSIQGLDDYMRPHPMNVTTTTVARAASSKPANGTASGNYAANDFRAAYVPGVTLTGAGQSMALVEFDGYYPADIASYENAFGLPVIALTNILLDDFATTQPIGNNNLEVALDIEMAASMAPGLSQIAVYEGDWPDHVLTQIVEDNLARQISCSWTYGVTSNTSAIFQQMAAQGQSFFTASGDDGAYPAEVLSPADDPNITVVGGTYLNTAYPNGPWTGETVWNRANTFSGTDATGGGISTVFPIPDWQTNIDMSANGGSTTMRNIPDVAMVADNIMVFYGNGAQIIAGGTSCSTPLWAGFMALMNQKAAAVGQPPLGFVNPALYALAKTSSYTALFHDITIGNNTNHSDPNYFYAVPGYDLCTGWGSPTSVLIDALVPTPPVLLSTISGGTNYSNGPFTFQISGLTGQGIIVVQASSNLVNWTPIFTNSPWFGPLQFTDTNTGYPRQFYRAVIER